MDYRFLTVHRALAALLCSMSTGCGGDATDPQPDPLSIALHPTHVSVCGGLDGAINLEVTGGTPPYSFAWSNGATTEDVDGLPAGEYEVTVRDAAADLETGSVALAQPEIILTFSVIDASTVDGSDGAVDLSVSGEGTPPYVYAWSEGSSTEDIEGLPRGTYVVTVTDAGGGFKTDSIAVIDPSQLRDVDGNVYNTVAIGGQVWLASNFRAQSRPNGSQLTQGADVVGGSWNPRYYLAQATGSATNESDPIFYNWAAAEVLAPAGWHVPSDEEWRALVDYLSVNGQGGAGTAAGRKMKSTSSSSGFNGLFTGHWGAGDFFVGGNHTYYWSSTTWANDDRDNWIFGLSADDTVERTVWDKRAAFSVRLLKDY
jgi:uncharacterized protein (TIGR02145 family)